MAQPVPRSKTETCCDNCEDSTRKKNDNAGGNCVDRDLSSERASESHHRAAHLCGRRLCPSRQSLDLGAAMQVGNRKELGAPLTERRFVLPFVLITSLFFLWAFGVNLNDILIPHFKRAFALSDFQSSFIQVAFFGGYFLAAFPAGRLMESMGYKRGILFGLGLCSAGALMFLPASAAGIYGLFLAALFVMACGQSFLEVAANPYVTILGPPESSERRLNFAQSFNSVGAVLSPIVGRAFILSGIEYSASELRAMPLGQWQ